MGLSMEVGETKQHYYILSWMLNDIDIATNTISSLGQTARDVWELRQSIERHLDECASAAGIMVSQVKWGC